MVDDRREYIENLFQRYLNNKCAPGEIKTLLQLFSADENEDLLRSLIREQFDVMNGASPISDNRSNPSLDVVFNKIKKAIADDHKTRQIPVAPFCRHRWFLTSAAAALVFAVSAVAFYFIRQKNEKIIVQNEINIPVKDILSGINNAVLMLGNGTTIVLDSAANGTLAQQGNGEVVKINGQIVYKKGTGDMKTKPIYNTVTTANGNEYELIMLPPNFYNIKIVYEYY